MKSYRLKGLDCPVCAQGIEDGIRKLEGVSSVSVDFGSLTMRVEAADLARVEAEVKRLEPEVVLEALDRKSRSSCSACEGEVKLEASRGSAGAGGTELKSEILKELLPLAGAAILGIAGFALEKMATMPAWLSPAIFIAAYLLAGWDVLLGAGRNILRGRVFDELFLMGIATLGALAIGQYAEALGVMIFYKIGEALQESAAEKSRASVRGLLALRPDTARVKRDGAWTLVKAEDAVLGESFLVLPGERIPLDGIVVEGESLVDTQALTGEPRPKRAAPGTELLAGCLAIDGSLEATALRAANESSAARIAELVENASHAKAKSERFISRFARVYTPVVVIAAALLAFIPPLLGAGSLAHWAYRSLVLLVISCPCALVISVPLGYFGGIGGAARRGILVKGGTVLDSLAKADCAVFDKTGTLTKGVFRVRSTVPAEGHGEDELLELAALAESRSRHPIALSIREAARSRGLPDGTEDEASNVREISGRGVIATIGERRILAGNEGLLAQEGIEVPAGDRSQLSGTRVFIAASPLSGGSAAYIGAIAIGDEAKDNSAAAIKRLGELGVGRMAILTGDEESAALSLARELGINEVHAGLLPEDKLAVLEGIIAENQAKGGNTVFVGDGVNDAPVLARADVGAAMGAGADVAVECADLILMNDDPASLVEAIERARRTRAIVMQNIVGALAIKAAFLALGALGIAVMWEAVIADVGVAILATLNATRAMK
jgi:Cd2+/Zn2+-exporting ATPase